MIIVAAIIIFIGLGMVACGFREVADAIKALPHRFELYRKK